MGEVYGPGRGAFGSESSDRDCEHLNPATCHCPGRRGERYCLSAARRGPGPGASRTVTGQGLVRLTRRRLRRPGGPGRPAGVGQSLAWTRSWTRSRHAAQSRPGPVAQHRLGDGLQERAAARAGSSCSRRRTTNDIHLPSHVPLGPWLRRQPAPAARVTRLGCGPARAGLTSPGRAGPTGVT
jgi:hypothetical protein